MNASAPACSASTSTSTRSNICLSCVPSGLGWSSSLASSASASRIAGSRAVSSRPISSPSASSCASSSSVSLPAGVALAQAVGHLRGTQAQAERLVLDMQHTHDPAV